MKPWISAKIGVAAFAMVVGAASANAQTRTITYTGTMASGSDQTGAMFTAGTDLTGLTFTATFDLDSSTSGATVIETSTQQQLSGYGTANPVHAALTIAGASTIYFGDTSGSSRLWDETWIDNAEARANNTSFAGGLYTYENLFLYLYNYNNGVSFYPGDVNYTPQPGDYGGGSFVLQSNLNFQNTRYVYGSFNVQNISIFDSAVGAIPEPSTWAMMLFGFGAIGIAMRRRRKLMQGLPHMPRGIGVLASKR